MIQAKVGGRGRLFARPRIWGEGEGGGRRSPTTSSNRRDSFDRFLVMAAKSNEFKDGASPGYSFSFSSCSCRCCRCFSFFVFFFKKKIRPAFLIVILIVLVCRKIFVGGLPKDTTTGELRCFFSTSSNDFDLLAIDCVNTSRAVLLFF